MADENSKQKPDKSIPPPPPPPPDNEYLREGDNERRETATTNQGEDVEKRRQ